MKSMCYDKNYQKGGMATVLVVVLYFLPPLTFSQTGVEADVTTVPQAIVTGKISNVRTGQPIEQAFVEINWGKDLRRVDAQRQGLLTHTWTSETGEFQLQNVPILPEKLSLHIGKRGYAAIREEIDISEASLRLDRSLQPMTELHVDVLNQHPRVILRLSSDEGKLVYSPLAEEKVPWAASEPSIGFPRLEPGIYSVEAYLFSFDEFLYLGAEHFVELQEGETKVLTLPEEQYDTRVELTVEAPATPGGIDRGTFYIIAGDSIPVGAGGQLGAERQQLEDVALAVQRVSLSQRGSMLSSHPFTPRLFERPYILKGLPPNKYTFVIETREDGTLKAEAMVLEGEIVECKLTVEKIGAGDGS